MFDEITICTRCGSDLAYHQEISENLTITQCLGCGFLTNSLMKINNPFLNEQMETLPNLYKELIVEDENGKIWIPSYVDVDEGMIFANGKNSENWKWAAVKKIPIPDSEKKKYPIPGKKNEYYSKKTDMGTLKEFDEKNYLDALDYLGLFEK